MTYDEAAQARDRLTELLQDRDEFNGCGISIKENGFCPAVRLNRRIEDLDIQALMPDVPISVLVVGMIEFW